LALLHQGQALLERAWDEGAGDAVVALGLAEASFDLQLKSQAIKWAKTALELDPRDVNDRIAANRILAELQFDAGRLEESLKAYDALALLRNDARDWYIRGMCELRLNRMEAGISSLNKSLALSPRQPDIHQVLASIYRSRGDAAREEEHSRLAKQME
jgi:tetratricopeptide (TPR) repeat protein